MSDEPKRRAGRPPKRVLSRELIFMTALKLIDERGVYGYGMRELARELGVQPSALYNHVSGQDEVIAGVRELIGERIDSSVFDTMPWDDALALWARSYRDAFAAHPPTIALLAVTAVSPDSHISLMYDGVLAALARAGWPLDQVMSVMVAVESFVLGSALDAVADFDNLNPGERGDVPTYTGAYEARKNALGGRSPADMAFELGVDVILSGLRARLTALTR